MLIKLLKMLRNVSVVAVLLSSSAAHAGLYQFNLSGDYNASWQLDSTLTSDLSEEDAGFTLEDVEGSFPGSLFDFADLTFFHESLGGGLEIYDFYSGLTLLLTDGPQMYAGPELTPTFLLGSFNLTDFAGSGTYLLTVTDLGDGPVDVPEPASGALLLGGLGMLYATRQRRRSR
jgi:hypothetical protein